LKRILILTLLINFSFGEDFISEFEYGQMLYKDPRGVSCASCHGTLGEKTFIASYKDKNGTLVEFYSPDIRKLGLKRFKKALAKGGRLMPRYYLTNSETEAIYKYIVAVNKESKVTVVSQEGNVTTQEESDSNSSDINATIDANESENNYYEELEDDNSSKKEENDSIISKIFKTPDEENEEVQTSEEIQANEEVQTNEEEEQ